MSMKNPLTLPGIEPATFRFVAQHFNHCATAEFIYKINQYFSVPELVLCLFWTTDVRGPTSTMHTYRLEVLHGYTPT